MTKFEAALYVVFSTNNHLDKMSCYCENLVLNSKASEFLSHTFTDIEELSNFEITYSC